MATLRERAGAARAREQILQSRERFWRPSEFNLQPSTTHHLLSALVDRGELRRIKRGLYWRGIKTPLGMAPPSPERLILEIAPGPGVGPAGLYAANTLRLSTQIPRSASFAIPGRAPDMSGTTHIESRTARRGRLVHRLNHLEVALLEVLTDWPKVVEASPAEATLRITQLLDEGNIRADKLAAAASTEPGRTRARLKAILKASGKPEHAARVPDPDPRTSAAALRPLALA